MHQQHDRDTEQDEPVRAILWWLSLLAAITYAVAFWGVP